MLSFDWFAAKTTQPSQLAAGGHPEMVQPVRVEVVNSSLQCPKCAYNYEDGMGKSWVQALGGQVQLVRPPRS